ncbi:sensor histidine kinase [Streptomyces ortus]|uniref:histidine kinase n=1 Tax=Streptomyces ortus TaxID=2867268 RepID=A0ABT3V0N5_9ACTN|nr:HAMP domain-containing sensor histidine kinase [Streptomyces ortus]MCX4232459.1 HAMP domain-containing histidine kinase [Streptomyces ortus]
MSRPRALDARDVLSRLPFRTRLAVAFSALFLLAGTALLAFVVVLARYGTARQVAGIEAEPVGDGISLRKVDTTVRAVQDAALEQMVLWSGIGLIVMALLAGLTGWWLAGRALRPVAAVTEAARRIGDTNLDERLALTGPDDELHRLADTFDTMLDRLQRAFDSQRRFVANASHELRTPLAAQRASIEVGLADPLPGHLVGVRDDLLTTNREAEQLIAALLLLARSERGLEETEPVDPTGIIATSITELRPLAAEMAVEIHAPVGTLLPLNGDPVLLRHLITNLLRNAVQYNRPRGRVDVSLTGRTLTVTNTGGPVDPARLDDLFEPFRRLGQDRVGTTGHGLGLSIVRFIAHAHGAQVTARPGPDGGLRIGVTFP